jgi:hypothetical protein
VRRACARPSRGPRMPTPRVSFLTREPSAGRQAGQEGRASVARLGL